MDRGFIRTKLPIQNLKHKLFSSTFCPFCSFWIAWLWGMQACQYFTHSNASVSQKSLWLAVTSSMQFLQLFQCISCSVYVAQSCAELPWVALINDHGVVIWRYIVALWCRAEWKFKNWVVKSTKSYNMPSLTTEDDSSQIHGFQHHMQFFWLSSRSHKILVFFTIAGANLCAGGGGSPFRAPGRNFCSVSFNHSALSPCKDSYSII